MRKLRKPMLLLDGQHWKVEFEKREYDGNIVEIVHIAQKGSKAIWEFYSSNYAVQIESTI